MQFGVFPAAIKCIIITNNYPNDTDALSKIKEGGINYNFAKFDFAAGNGRDLNFTIRVYVDAQAVSPYALRPSVYNLRPY